MKKRTLSLMLSSFLLIGHTALWAQDNHDNTMYQNNHDNTMYQNNNSSATMTTTETTTEGGWKGELYEITPKRADVTVDYCKSHAPDTYKTSASMVDKTIVGDNKVKAKDLGYTTKEEGGVYMHKGTAIFSGETDGKPWQEKVVYISQTLDKSKSMEQGAWYTKDCKGFYKVGPESKM